MALFFYALSEVGNGSGAAHGDLRPSRESNQANRKAVETQWGGTPSRVSDGLSTNPGISCQKGRFSPDSASVKRDGRDAINRVCT